MAGDAALTLASEQHSRRKSPLQSFHAMYGTSPDSKDPLQSSMSHLSAEAWEAGLNVHASPTGHYGDPARLPCKTSPRGNPMDEVHAVAASGAQFQVEKLRAQAGILAAEQHSHRNSPLLSFQALYGTSPDRKDSLQCSMSHLSAEAWEIPDDPPQGPYGMGTCAPEHLKMVAMLLENQRRSEEAQQQQALQNLHMLLRQQQQLSQQAQLQARLHVALQKTPAGVGATLQTDGKAPNTAALTGEQRGLELKDLEQSIAHFLMDYQKLVVKSGLAEQSPKRRRSSSPL